jgi:EpsI family protein
MQVLRTSILLALLMLAASIGAVALRPTHKLADDGPRVDLEAMIPRQFGEWSMVQDRRIVAANPQETEVLNKIYSQTLSRSYADAKGNSIMLSIAYGGDQRDSMQVHKPEVCYPAQGFALLGKESGTLATHIGNLPVTRLVASLGQRREPITYWTTIGDQVVAPGIQKKLVEMKYALAGTIPDGLLFRVSSIDGDSRVAFEQQGRFVDQLLQSVEPDSLNRLAGVSPSR